MNKMLLPAVLAALFATSAFAGGRHKIRTHDPAEAAGLVAGGATLVADYGSFQVLDVSGPVQLSAAATAEYIDAQNFIELNAGAIDTRNEIPAARLQTLAGGSQLRLVQFAGPVKPEWLAELTDSGAQIVTYIPQNAYLVYAPPAAVAAVRARKAAGTHISFEGAYLEDDKIQPRARLFDAQGNVRVFSNDCFAVQMVDDAAANAASMQIIDAIRLASVFRQERRGGYFNVIVRLPPAQIANVAARPDVVSVGLYSPRRKFDERQDQIVAGNLTGTQPAGPGYLAWLGSKGFTQSQFTSSGFVVDVCDSGVDNGTATPNHFGLFTSGDTSQTSRVVYNRLEGTANSGSTIQGCDGHGNLNSHIIAGYVGLTNFPHTDSTGYRYGLGACPFVKVGSSVIFDPSSFTTPNYDDMLSRAYRDGARISSDSWGADTGGDYDIDAQNYDALVRDAQPSGAAVPNSGNQEMAIVFAAGNAGPSTQTVGSPGTAKNVITVGAAENVHSHSITNGGADSSGNDGCTTPDSEANSAADIASFSSRGPCSDNRAKPEICAPGTHITSGVAQQTRTMQGTGNDLSCFTGEGVCALSGGGTAGSTNNFFPRGQQFYSTSSGTSHSTPAVAGGCALVRQYFINQGWNAPTPAMLKAFLVNSARYMTGTYANDSLFSNSQGFGDMNLGTAFDGTPRVMRDQLTNDLFTATGQTRVFPITINSASKPFRISLAWTDAPGATSGNAYNNDLNLSVTIGGTTYKGNVFSGANSVSGGSADARNNTECVFLGAGVTGAAMITVSAANINSDGVPNSGGSLDQDFSLVIYNATAGASNQPPALNPVGDRTATVTNLLQFSVTASDLVDGDAIALAATNLPSWATFASVTNAGGVTNIFAGTPPTTGVFAVTFLATDKDGTASETININVVAGGVSTNLIDEHFDGGTTAPAGWTFTAIGATYTSAGNFGRRSPSLKLDATGDIVETPVFANGTNLSFWIKGNSTDSSSSLLVEGLAGSTWGTILNFAPLPTTGTTYSTSLSVSVTKLRFTYTKTAGNLAFDDVIVNGFGGSAPPASSPPQFNSIVDQSIAAGATLQFSVSAAPTDGDTVSLAMSNAPTGAIFSSTNENGTFIWSPASPAGNYSPIFYATDKDGTVSTTISITVTSTNVPSGCVSTNLIAENFDAATTVPSGWISTNTANDNVSSHYHSAPNCRSMGTNSVLITPSVNSPTQLTFYVDASSSGNGKAGSVEYAIAGGMWTPLATFVAGTAGSVVTNALNASPNLAGVSNVQFRFSSSFATWYLDDVAVNGSVCGSSPAGAPPVFNALSNQSVTQSNTLQFAVSAQPTDGDAVTLSVSNAPAGSTFSSTNANGTFLWLSASPAGSYLLSFYASDKDGTVMTTITITVTSPGSENGCVSTNLLAEGFDAARTLPVNWDGTNSANDTMTTHYRSAPNCRALSSNCTVVTPPVNNPTQLTFYVDSSNGGNGNPARVDYAIAGGGWVPLSTFVVSTVGAIVTNALTSAPDLSGATNVQFRFVSSFNTWYLDDVMVAGTYCSSSGGPADSNGNGIDDAWELTNFGDLATATMSSDTDLDGFSDLSEYLAGTQPTNAASLLIATAVTNLPGTGNIIVWQSASNKIYAIDRAMDLIVGFGSIATNLPATPPMNVYTDSVSTNAAGFYRVRLWP